MAVIHGQYGLAGTSKALQLGVHASDLQTLIHSDDQVDQNDYGDACYLQLWGSGEMLGFHFLTLTEGEGAVIEPAGKLLIFKDAVTVTAGDTAITVAERVELIGMVQVNADDWQADANGASQYICCTPIAFPRADNYYIYFVFFLESAASFNDAGGDDEVMYFRVFYRLDTRE